MEGDEWRTGEPHQAWFLDPRALKIEENASTYHLGISTGCLWRFPLCHQRPTLPSAMEGMGKIKGHMEGKRQAEELLGASDQLGQNKDLSRQYFLRGSPRCSTLLAE